MTDKDEILAQLSEERRTYPEFVEAVDADLKIERLRRLATRQGVILNLVAEAFARGASKRAIMRAYGTKDFGTIQRILDSMAGQITQIKDGIEEQAVVAKGDWFEVVTADHVYIGEAGFDVIWLDGDEPLLNQIEGETVPEWDGRVLTSADTGDFGVLYLALMEAKEAQ